jgi:exosortase/archaeosortase family protein
VPSRAAARAAAEERAADRQGPGAPAARPTGWWRFALAFAAGWLLLHLGYLALRGAPQGLAWIDAVTVQPAAALLRTLGGSDVLAQGALLRWGSGQLQLRNGCDALDLMALYIAAVMASPWPWRSRLAWGVGGLLLLWAANQGRIAALYGAFRFRPEWFDALHGALGPLALVAVAVALYLGAQRALGEPLRTA